VEHIRIVRYHWCEPMTLRDFVRASSLVHLLPCLVLSAEPSQHGPPQPLDLNHSFSVDNIVPRGLYYEARVPDTLDLSERARLAVHALT